MHVAVYRVMIDPDRRDESDAFVRQTLAPGMKAEPGFQRGFWAQSADHEGIAFLVYESEDAARAGNSGGELPADAPITFKSLDFYEVVAEA